MPLRIPLLVAVVGVAALLLPGAAVSKGSQQTELAGTVGPGFTITLTRDGQRVTRLDPGTYTIRVDDRSPEHNFHLSGPGVDMETEVEATGTVTWTVTLRNGTYRYVCDPHAPAMRGSFTVGDVQPRTPRPQRRLTGNVGPGFTISLTSAGRRASRLAAGTYRITVRDRSRMHNFHLTGRGINKATGVRFRGTRTWTVRLRTGRYRFRCDPHATRMRGSFRVT